MKINPLSPDRLIQQELGTRLRKIRKQVGFTQAELSETAGIGIATLRRIEDGQDSQLSSWVKLLKALGMIDAVDQLLPEAYNSPMAEARQRKSRTRTEESPAPIWRDELK